MIYYTDYKQTKISLLLVSFLHNYDSYLDFALISMTYHWGLLLMDSHQSHRKGRLQHRVLTLSWFMSDAHSPQCRQEKPQRRWEATVAQGGAGNPSQAPFSEVWCYRGDTDECTR